MNSFEQVLKVANSYGISDGVKVESMGMQINVTGKYFGLYFDVEDEELFITITSTSYEEPVIFEMLYDEAAAFQNMEEELRPLLHKCIKEVNNLL